MIARDVNSSVRFTAPSGTRPSPRIHFIGQIGGKGSVRRSLLSAESDRKNSKFLQFRPCSAKQNNNASHRIRHQQFDNQPPSPMSSKATDPAAVQCSLSRADPGGFLLAVRIRPRALARPDSTRDTFHVPRNTHLRYAPRSLVSSTERALTSTSATWRRTARWTPRRGWSGSASCGRSAFGTRLPFQRSSRPVSPWRPTSGRTRCCWRRRE